MKTTIKEITPQWAAGVLETKNIQNRKISESVVDKYTRDMINGDWCLTHQGIALDVNGDLLDGQHRLAAVVKSKKTIRMMVTFGLPTQFQNNGHKTDTFACIDGVRPRSPAILLEIMKYKNSARVAAIAKGIAILCMDDYHNVRMTAAITERIVKQATPTIETIASQASGQGIVRMRSAALAVIAFYHTTKPEIAETFLNDVQSVNGAKGSPSRALSNWLSHHPQSGGALALQSIYVTASALYHQSKGTSVDKLYGGEDSVRWLIQTNPALKKNVVSFLM